MKDEQISMVDDYIKAYNAMNVEGMLTHLHDSVVFINSSNGVIDMTLHGKTAFKEQADQAIHYFSEREQTVLDRMIVQDQIEVRLEYRAILAMDLPNGLKKGDTLNLNGTSIFTFQENKIIKIEDKS